MIQRDGHLPGLDDGLERVREARDHLQRDRGVAVVGAEARGRVGHLRRGRAPHHPRAQALQHALRAWEVLDRPDLPIADDHVGPPRKDRLDEPLDVRGGVLVVGIRVDDDVRADLHGGVEAGVEPGGEALVAREPDDVVDAVGPGDLDRAIGGAVVDDEPLDRLEAGDLARQLSEGDREDLLSLRQGI